MGQSGRDNRLELVGLPESDPFGLEPSGERISLEIATEEAPRLVRHRLWLVQRGVEIVFATRGPLFRAVNTAAGLGLAVRLRPTAEPHTPPQELWRVMDLYLRSPHVRAPIEPFHTVVMHLIRGPQTEDPTLFHIYGKAGEPPGHMCTSCPAVAVCAGYLSASTGSCPEEWRGIFEHLAAAAAEIRRCSNPKPVALPQQPPQEGS